jgi:hypothetical protein
VNFGGGGGVALGVKVREGMSVAVAVGGTGVEVNVELGIGVGLAVGGTTEFVGEMVSVGRMVGIGLHAANSRSTKPTKRNRKITSLFPGKRELYLKMKP